MIRILCIIVCLSMNCLLSQSPDNWKEVVAGLDHKQPSFRVVIHYQDTLKKANENAGIKLWEVCSTLEILENPLCRCLPNPQGQIVFFFAEGQNISVEIVQDHWFRAYYVGKDQHIKFLMRDEKNILFRMIEKLMLSQEQSSVGQSKPLCPECSQKMFIMSIGSCQECGEMTSSSAYKYCDACARSKGVCQVCGKSMK